MNLSISDNMIRNLDPKILSRSPHLGNIFLNNNQLTAMLNLSAISRTVMMVSLDNNKIGEVPAGFLQNLTHLVQLGLSGNKIKHFPGRTLVHIC